MSPDSVWPEKGRSVLSWQGWDIERRKEEGVAGGGSSRDNRDKKALDESEKEVPVGRGVGEK